MASLTKITTPYKVYYVIEGYNEIRDKMDKMIRTRDTDGLYLELHQRPETSSVGSIPVLIALTDIRAVEFQ